MVKGILHRGSGLGNQLHRYVGTKIIALEKGEEHSMIAPELFKGGGLFNLNLKDETKYTVEEPSGRVIPESYEGVVDGEFQAEKDFIGHLDEVREWLKVEPIEMHEDVCVINFRGGEYAGVPELFLPYAYWLDGVRKMVNINPNMRFLIATDDEKLARIMLPGINVIEPDTGIHWRAIRYAKYLILSNSSFAILPAYLNENVKKIIAPKYWARYNTKEWINPDNSTYSKFSYIHHED